MNDKPARVLLVEDDEAHAELIRRAFAGHGTQYDLAVAGNLAEARNYLTDTLPDLIIADLRLPDGKGTDLLAAGAQGASYKRSCHHRLYPRPPMSSCGFHYT